MCSLDRDHQSIHEVGKIYNSFLDKKLLCDFFVESVQAFVHACGGYLFLSGAEDQLWLESSSDPAGQLPGNLVEEAKAHFQKGQPVCTGKALFVPLIVRNTEIGIACFVRDSASEGFSGPDLEAAANLAAQMAGALKNILLYEQNIKMERLAAIGQTVSMVLHEVKNIIQLATFSSDWLKRGIEKGNQEFLKRGMKGMEKAIKNMNGFVYEMLSLTKDYKIEAQKVDPKDLLKELQGDLEEKARQFNAELDFQVEENFPQVDMEYQSIYRSLLNIVKNALEACRQEKSFVRIRVFSVDPDTYQITVEDNGQGMSEEVRAKLFQAFFSTKGEKGTGLGLMVIDKTVKAHHGKIAVESEIGKGTKFILTFPKIIS
ncbi:MAG: HAMP domain-containing histidine kinase [Candidatus Omnitrophica bacterium]|nr:HAMP domain-containing histidine kinase [Candidatus Omnitrophota bacterium]